MKIDHLFIFTPRSGSEADALVDYGLTEGPGNVHPGQGTANRRFFFKNCYLEILWVENVEEILSEKVKPTLLWQRAGLADEQASPFGLCLKPTIDSDTLFKNALKYFPPYFYGKMAIDVIASKNAPEYPWLFRLPLKMTSNAKAANQMDFINELFVTRLTFEFPMRNEPDAGINILGNEKWITFNDSLKYHLTIEFNYAKRNKKTNFNGILPLTLHQ